MEGGTKPLTVIGARLDLNFDIPWKRPIAGGPHFSEVGYTASCARAAIVKRLKQCYLNVRSGRFASRYDRQRLRRLCSDRFGPDAMARRWQEHYLGLMSWGEGV